MTIGHSYSSPWLPPSRITVGPWPLLMTLIGIRVTPHASSSGECGIMTNPTCLPGRSRSTVAKAGVGEGLAGFMIFLSGWVRQQALGLLEGVLKGCLRRVQLLPRINPHNHAPLDHAG